MYLDSAATSQKPRAMIERMAQLYSHEYARVEEGHTLSREATRAFEGTRGRVAKLINAAEPREIVFCRGATEALNLLANAFGDGPLQGGGEVLVTGAEHSSNVVPWLLACRRTGARLRAGKLEAEPLLRSLGVEEAVRASFTFYNTHAEADALADALRRIAG